MWNWASTVGIESRALRVAEFAGELAMSISSPLAYRPSAGGGRMAFWALADLHRLMHATDMIFSR